MPEIHGEHFRKICSCAQTCLPGDQHRRQILSPGKRAAQKPPRCAKAAALRKSRRAAQKPPRRAKAAAPQAQRGGSCHLSHQMMRHRDQQLLHTIKQDLLVAHRDAHRFISVQEFRHAAAAESLYAEGEILSAAP